jgi:hypothetical protein
MRHQDQGLLPGRIAPELSRTNLSMSFLSGASCPWVMGQAQFSWLYSILLGHVQQTSISRLRDGIFAEIPPPKRTDDRIVVSRKDDESLCSKEIASPPALLYDRFFFYFLTPFNLKFLKLTTPQLKFQKVVLLVAPSLVTRLILKSRHMM